MVTSGILIYLIIVNLLLVFKLAWDWYAKNKQNRIINHALSAVIDGVIYMISAWFIFGINSVGWVILAVGYRWVFFDIGFNLLNGDKWNHYGTSSKLDLFLTRLGKWHLLPKFILIIAGLWLIIN